jgi:hypothetical protein
MAKCRLGCRHRAFVLEYRIDRHNAELLAEAASGGNATELAEYVAANPLPTFKEWLRHNARRVS